MEVDRVAGRHSGSKLLRGGGQSKIGAAGRREAFWFTLPAVVVMMLVTLGPLAYSLYVSFTGWTLTLPGSEHEFVGLSNYARAIDSEEFWYAVWVTVKFSAIATTCEFVLSVAMAMMLNHQFVGRGIVRALLLIPLVLTPSVVGMFWKLLYDDQQGVFNYFLVTAGLPRAHWLGPGLALTSVIVADIWQSTPFLVLIALAGLNAIDLQVIEAARMDGANRWQIFRFVTLPHLMPYLLIGVFFRLLDAMKEFDKIYLLTQGGPGMETSTISIYAFDTGFKVFQIGRTSAVAWLIAILTLIASAPLLRILTARMGNDG